MKFSWWVVVAVGVGAYYWSRQREQYAVAKAAAQRVTGDFDSDPFQPRTIPVALPKGAAVAVVPGASLRPDEPTHEGPAS